MMKSKINFFKKLARTHAIHHHFYPTNLQINTKWTRTNFLYHVYLEHGIQFIVILFCGLFVSPWAILIALLMQLCVFSMVWYRKGEDVHHRSVKNLPAHSGAILVDAPYHALHHIFPKHYFSGYIKVFDYICGTGLPLADRRITMTGARGALGRHMKQYLEKEGAIITPCQFGLDYNYNDYEKLRPILAETDILLLCHGSKYDHAQQANCDSFVALIELFKESHSKRFLPLEIWAVGSESECHPSFGFKKFKVYAESKRNYAKHAHGYYHDKTIQYRHLVHSGFISPMGPGLMTAKFAAWMTVFFLKRGFKYVPVTYTGIAYINYLRFLLRR